MAQKCEPIARRNAFRRLLKPNLSELDEVIATTRGA